MTAHDTLARCILAFEAGLADCRHADDRSRVAAYLAALAAVLARATLGEDILGDIQRTERLPGNTWLVDLQPFQSALDHWRQFRDEYERFALGGMTVNERLCAIGLMETYEVAVADGDRQAMRRLLERVYVDEASIRRILDGA